MADKGRRPAYETHVKEFELTENYMDCGWIPWFCSLYGHEIFAEVDEDFIRDGFNLFGLKPKFNKYEKALAMILGRAPIDEGTSIMQPKKNPKVLPDFRLQGTMEVYQQAADLYALIHARYITTPRGIMTMKQKYINGEFGYCPRVLCDHQPVLPVGLTDELRAHRVRLYCPKCQEIYVPRSCGLARSCVLRSSNSSSRMNWDSEEDDQDEEGPDDDTDDIFNAAGGSRGAFRHADIDGAFFGPSFPHSFLLQFNFLIPKGPPAYYVPKVYGFRIFKLKSVIQTKYELVRSGWIFHKFNKGEFGMEYVKQKNHQPTTSPARME